MTVPPSLSNVVYSNMRIMQVDLDPNSVKIEGGGGGLSFFV